MLTVPTVYSYQFVTVIIRRTLIMTNFPFTSMKNTAVNHLESLEQN